MAVENNIDQIKVLTSKDEESTCDYKNEPNSKRFGIRHGQSIIFFFCLAISIIARGHIGVTIVAMTSTTRVENFPNHLTDGIGSQTDIYDNITKANNNNETINMINDNNGIGNGINDTEDKKSRKEVEEAVDEYWYVHRTYNWTKPIHETVISSFYLGYGIAMLPMGLITQRWGGKLPLQLSLLLNGVLSLLTPWLSLWGGWKAVSACRLMQGLCQAGTYPSLQMLLSSWVPINERATMLSYVYTGTSVGNIIGFQIGGLLADSVGGWPSTFWAVGLMCLACFVILTVYGAATPLAHNKITIEEKVLIRGHSDGVALQRLNKRIPWKAIMTSVPVWSNFVTHIGSSSTFLFFCSQVASYNHYILGTNVKNSGFLSSMPYIGGLFFSFIYGWISDYMTKRNIITLKSARRLFNSLSQVGLTACFVGVTFAKSTVAASVWLILCMICQTAAHCGWMVNHIDIASNYSGTLMSVGNTMTNIVNLIIPVVMSNIVVDLRNPAQWHTMLYLIAGLSFVTNIVFVLFLSVEDQPWNKQYADDDEMEDAKEKLTEEKDPLQSKSYNTTSGSLVIPKITEVFTTRDATVAHAVNKSNNDQN